MPFVIDLVIAFFIVFNRHRYRERVYFDSTLPSAVTYNLEIQIVHTNFSQDILDPKNFKLFKKNKVEY